jgi:hypothetical protein
MGVNTEKLKGLTFYRMVMPQSFCSLQRGFYIQPIILEFSYQQYIPRHKSKTTFLLPRWMKGKKKKVRQPDGSFREYPVLAFYICVNRDLARRGTFRQAHHAAGAVVALAEKSGKSLDKLSRGELLSVNELALADGFANVNKLPREEVRPVKEKFGRNALGVFDLQRAMTRRNLIGAPGTKEVAKQLAKWRKIL